MLRTIIAMYGKDKLNSLTKYPSILTLHKMGERGKLIDELSTPISGEVMLATEKIDGTNVRIICCGDECIIGSREFLLSHSDDLFYDPAMGIVDAVRRLISVPRQSQLTVLYGELYGGKVTANSKWYGTDKVGFRLFDAVQFANYDDFADILSLDIAGISRWREHETNNGLSYGQPFLTYEAITHKFPMFEMVPYVTFSPDQLTHTAILSALKVALPTTNVALSESATGGVEGLILRNADRSRIVKVRFEDYHRTLR